MAKEKKTSNKYFTYQHYHNKDEITINTNNIAFVRDNPVLVIDNNKAVFLKDWQVIPIHSYYHFGDAYAVKLNRNYFKEYTFKNGFNNMYFDKKDTFDRLVKIAKEQDKANIPVAFNHMK